MEVRCRSLLFVWSDIVNINVNTSVGLQITISEISELNHKNGFNQEQLLYNPNKSLSHPLHTRYLRVRNKIRDKDFSQMLLLSSVVFAIALVLAFILVFIISVRYRRALQVIIIFIISIIIIKLDIFNHSDDFPILGSRSSGARRPNWTKSWN